jgi:hypothetical protein
LRQEDREFEASRLDYKVRTWLKNKNKKRKEKIQTESLE